MVNAPYRMLVYIHIKKITLLTPLFVFEAKPQNHRRADQMIFICDSTNLYLFIDMRKYLAINSNAPILFATYQFILYFIFFLDNVGGLS